MKEIINSLEFKRWFKKNYNSSDFSKLPQRSRNRIFARFSRLDYLKEYRKTPKYKEYRQTPKYKEYQKEYQKTPKYREYQKEYKKRKKGMEK